MAKALRATETGPFSASQAAISAKKDNDETFFIKTLLNKSIYQQKKTSNHPTFAPLRQLNTLTLLVLRQLHRGVDVGRHLVGAEAAALLVSAVGVVAL